MVDIPRQQDQNQIQQQVPVATRSSGRFFGLYVMLLIFVVIVLLGILAFKALTGDPSDGKSLENPPPPSDVDTNPF